MHCGCPATAGELHVDCGLFRLPALLAALMALAGATGLRAEDLKDPLGDRVAELHKRISPALVMVKITYESDDRERRELERPGIVIAADGLIMFPASEG